MTLQKIREANEEELQVAVRDVIAKQSVLTLGEIHATTRTILERAEKLGCVQKVNQWARGEF